MTVSTEVARKDYAGNGVLTTFPTTFRFLDNSHLKVILVVDSTGVETTQTITTDYTVTGADAAAGGDVEMITPPASGETLIIKRSIPNTQLTDLQTNGPLPADAIEDMVDQLTMRVQESDERVDRSLHFKESSTLTDIEMDDLVADKLLIVNSTGDGVEMGPTADDIAGAQAEATAAAASAAAALVSETNAAASEAVALAAASELVVATGTADAIVATHATPVTLADKTRVAFRAIFANATTTPTYAPDGLTAHTIVKEGRVALVAGDIADDQVVYMAYNLANTEWEMENPVSPTNGEFRSMQIFTSTGNYTKPAGLKRVEVTVIGGGGAGGGASTTSGTQGSAGSGGGGGGTAILVIEAVDIVDGDTVTVGAGGVGASGAAGGSGGASSFAATGATPVTPAATGGAGGLNMAANTGVTAQYGGAGGVGTIGNINIKGSGGTSSQRSPGSDGFGGTGGNSYMGGGAEGTGVSSGQGSVGGVYGGGGSGSTNTISEAAKAGGNGGKGVVIVKEFF